MIVEYLAANGEWQKINVHERSVTANELKKSKTWDDGYGNRYRRVEES